MKPIAIILAALGLASCAASNESWSIKPDEATAELIARAAIRVLAEK